MSLASSALAGGFFTTAPSEKPWASLCFGLILVALLTSRHNVVVQSFSRVLLFETPWTVALQASLSSIISWSLVRLIGPRYFWRNDVCFNKTNSKTNHG